MNTLKNSKPKARNQKLKPRMDTNKHETFMQFTPLTLTLSPRRGNSQRMFPVLRKIVWPIPSHHITKMQRAILPLRSRSGRGEGRDEVRAKVFSLHPCPSVSIRG